MKQIDILISNQSLGSINPLVCGFHNCDSGHCFGPAVREYFLIHYVQSGEGKLISPRGTHKVKAGQMFIIRPNEVNTYIADSLNPWHYTWVGFTTDRREFESILSLDVIEAPECAHIFHRLELCTDIVQGREWYICGLIYEIMASLRRKNQPKENISTAYAAIAINFIRSNYMQEIKVEQIAENLGLERSYFSSLFKKATGKSPQQYLVDFRLEKAASLISRGEFSIGEVAIQVGYTDMSSFYRMFKRKFGLPPSKYLK